MFVESLAVLKKFPNQLECKNSNFYLRVVIYAITLRGKENVTHMTRKIDS